MLDSVNQPGEEINFLMKKLTTLREEYHYALNVKNTYAKAASVPEQAMYYEQRYLDIPEEFAYYKRELERLGETYGLELSEINLSLEA